MLDYYTPPGTSLTETSREVAQIDAILSATPEVDTFSRCLGTGLGGDLGESYHGDYFVRLKPDHARTTPDVTAAVLAGVQAKVPGVQVELAQLMEDLVGDLTAVPQPIEIKLYGADTATLMPEAEKVATAISSVSGVVEVKSGVKLAGDALDLQIDPVRAAFEGVTADDVARAVDAALTGTVATQLPQATKVVGVRVRIPDAGHLRETMLADLPIRAARTLQEAGPGDISFLENDKNAHLLHNCRASAVVTPITVPANGVALIHVSDPLTAFVAIHRHLHAVEDSGPHGVDGRAAEFFVLA